MPNCLKISFDVFSAKIISVSDNFKNVFTHLFKENPNYKENSILQERISSGATYFSDCLIEILLPIVSSLKVEIDNKQLDKRYFLFMFNTYKDVKRQKERELQGTGAVLRIPLRALGEITIPVVTLEKQKKIGKIYIERIKLQSKLNKYSDLFEQFTNSIIEEALKGDD